MFHSKRLKPISLLASLAVSGLTLLSWTMVWFVVGLGGTEDSRPPIEVGGEIAAPALAALSLAGLALVAALSIAGPVFRMILGSLHAVIGACVLWSAVSAVSSPAAASAPAITEATGITGTESVGALIAAVSPTAWPILTIVLGIASVGIGAFIAVTGPRWPGSSAKYRAVKFEPVSEPRSTVSDWDSLSDGSDPTSR